MIDAGYEKGVKNLVWKRLEIPFLFSRSDLERYDLDFSVYSLSQIAWLMKYVTTVSSHYTPIDVTNTAIKILRFFIKVLAVEQKKTKE